MGPLLSFILFYVSFPVREEWPLAGAATFSSSLDSQWVIRIESRRGQSRCGDMHGKCVAIISNGSYGLGRKNNVKRNLFKRWRRAAAADFFDFKCSRATLSALVFHSLWCH
jgi:hypothetical protein